MSEKNISIGNILGCILLTVSAAAQSNGALAPPDTTKRIPTLETPAIAPELVKKIDQLSFEEIGRMQRKLSDWPQLSRYHDENAIVGSGGPSEGRVVFYGDSITDGWGRRYGSFFPGKPYINRGISGQTTQQMVSRFVQDVVNLHPAAVVILAGINDIAGNTGVETMSTIEDNLRAMTLMAKATHTRVILCSLLPAARIKPRPLADPTQEVIEINKWIASFAEREHITFLNYYPAMVGPDGGLRPELTVDGAVHPNAAGYAVMEPLAEQAVKNAFKLPRP
jgi:lysophospholipase L1-like esterase